MLLCAVLSQLLLLAIALGCAGSYYADYRAEHPGWESTFPKPGLGLHESLAGLQAPSGSGVRVWPSKLVVLRLDGEPAVALQDDEIQARLGNSEDDLAIVVAHTCLSEIDLRRYRAEKVSWLLLEGGRLSGWDLHVFDARCVMWNSFQPASRGSAALEERVRRFQDAHFPASMTHPSELYSKGLIYLDAGRQPAARQMLERGDQGFDVSDSRTVRFERPSDAIDVVGAEEVAHLRERLVSRLEASRVD